VNPEDERTRDFVGKTAILPLMNRKIPVVADEAVDPEFGSGFVKVTPAHDPNDFEIAERHSLPHVIVIDRQGKMTADAGERFAGLDRFEARKAVLKALEDESILVKIEPHQHSVGQHDRCSTIIEPLLSREWFVKMKPLAEPAIDVAQNGDIEFYPPRWKNVYLSWMTNIRDWCVSRQLWWGHRIPVWYCPDGHLTVSVDDPTACGECGAKELTQDENVLDTWFSSWLWTFSPLGWPEKTKDLEAFHPTSVLVTGSEIIFFWVARMIMSSLEFLGEIPFRQVFLTGIVRDTQGRKMSKSLGNSPDPLDIIDRFGTDPFRFTLVMLSPPGRDVFFAEEKLEMGRNFLNKIWQASRLIMTAYENDGDGLLADKGVQNGACDALSTAWNDSHDTPLAFEPALEWEDRWILSALNHAVREVDEKLTGSRLNEGAARVYDFFWSDFCDWYLELAKIRLYGDGDKRTVLATMLFVLGQSVKMLHPLMPYVTEELWANLPMSSGLLLEQRFPVPGDALADSKCDSRMTLFRGLVTSVRNIRALYGIAPSTTIDLAIKHPEGGGEALREMSAGVCQLAKVSNLTLGADVSKEKGSASSPVGDHEVIVPLAGVADLEAELKRLGREKDKVEKELSTVDRKLSNDNFIEKAKEEVVEKARQKRDVLQTELKKIEESMHIISDQR
jgi:valyl-tRNA synthetase